MTNRSEQWKPNGRPQSTIARSFAAALDDMFKLDGVGALELSVEQKKDDVKTQETKLKDLDNQIREANERLQKLEAKHKRRSQMVGNNFNTSNRRSPIAPVFETEYSEQQETSEDSGGDYSNSVGRSSPSDNGERRS